MWSFQASPAPVCKGEKYYYFKEFLVDVDFFNHKVNMFTYHCIHFFYSHIWLQESCST